MRKILLFLAMILIIASAALPAGAAGNIPPYELGDGETPDAKAQVVVDGNGLHYTAANSMKGDGTTADTYLIFSDPLKLDGLKITWTLDDDRFRMVEGVDHWFGFAFTASKIPFPGGLAGQKKLKDDQQGFTFRMLPYEVDINLFVDRMDKTLGFVPGIVNTGIGEMCKQPVMKTKHTVLFKVVGTDIFFNADDVIAEDGDYYWNQIPMTSRYFPDGKAYMSMVIYAGVDPADGKQKPMTFSVNDIQQNTATKAPSSASSKPSTASSNPTSSTPAATTSTPADASSGDTSIEDTSADLSDSSVESLSSLDSTDSSSEDAGGNPWIIVIIIACILAIAGIGVGTFFYLKKFKNNSNSNSDDKSN